MSGKHNITHILENFQLTRCSECPPGKNAVIPLLLGLCWLKPAYQRRRAPRGAGGWWPGAGWQAQKQRVPLLWGAGWPAGQRPPRQ